MSSSNNEKVISKASPHTVKKFDLIEEYIKSWAQKLMLNEACNGLVFIDCMCSSGMYTDAEGKFVKGTPVRVAEALLDVARTYTQKQVFLYLNDNSKDKIKELKKHLPSDERNFRIVTSVGDGNELLKTIGLQLNQTNHLHFFLLYDPYDASIDWEALLPFFKNWGEVLINHMISDSIRAISQVKNDSAKKKYEGTYLVDDVKKLIPFGSNKAAYEQRLREIIEFLKGYSERKYYIAAFPFFNTKNSLVYDLVHCTSHEAGFKLFKTTAWKTFGDKSSLKNRHGEEGQLMFDFTGESACKPVVDDYCYDVYSIVSYVQDNFCGKKDVPLEDIWSLLDEHPVFPSDGYRSQIKSVLKQDFGAQMLRQKTEKINFSDKRG
ncbi:three-Cys-motif partner protein TcmP [Anaerocolumna jejuensis]|uniref:three-Cys-motif partner protein TcmP n=1 Tax=Anaerocolumna jejuensis TaxID=259063 RepID=UPI003F7C523C